MDSGTARQVETGKLAWHYERRCPERTLLYQLVAEHYPRFIKLLAAQGRSLPAYVQREFDDFLKCGILEHGFLRVRCQECHSECLVAFSCKRRGYCPSCGARRMVESAALLVDKVLPRPPMRQWVLSFPFQLRFLIASRPEIMSRVLGLVYRAIETHLIHQAGCTRATAKTGSVTLIQRFGSVLNLNIHFHMLFVDGVYLVDRDKTAGFSLHAGVAAKAHQRRKLERVCRYDVEGSPSVAGGRKPGATIARPAVATDRLALTPQGNVRHTLKTPYRDGTTHIILEPLDLIARLAALVPKPRVNLTRFHGVFAPTAHCANR
jgi:hypothetical protein